VRKRTWAWVLSIVIMLLFSTAGCGRSYSGKKSPVASSGIMDLRNWDFNSDGPVRLSGEWEFYWKQLLNPEDFNGTDMPVRTAYISLPEYWSDFRVNGEKLPVMGYATHRLTILLPEKCGDCAVRNTAIATSFRLFVDGNLIRHGGVVGRDRESSIPDYEPGVSPVSLKGGEMTIIIQVSNFNNYHGGIGEAVILGGKDDLLSEWGKLVFFEIFLFGSIIIIAFYHLGVFILMREDKSPLYFFMLSATLAIFNQFSGELFFYKLFLKDMGWAFRFLIVNLSLYLFVPSMLMFIAALFPGEVNKRFIRITWMVAVLLTVLALVTPTHIYAWGFAFFLLYLLGSLIYSFYCLVRAWLKKRQGALIMLIGFVFFLVTAMIDALSYNNILPFYTMSNALGLFIFICSQAYLLAGRYALAFNAEKRLVRELGSKSEELMVKNLALDRDIEERIKAEKELENTRNYLNNVFNSLSSLLISIDAEGKITQWNIFAEIYTGVVALQAKGKSIWEVIPFISAFRNDIEKVFVTNRPVELSRLAVDINGRHYLNITASPLVFDHIHGAVIRIDDVTELEMKEEQLRQAQKMETVGTLAGGLAHDFNNVLSGIIGTVTLLKYIVGGDMTIDEEIRDGLDLIEISGNRAAQMVQQLMALSRKHEFSSVTVDLNAVIKNVMDICSNTFDKSILLKPEYSQEKALVRGDPAQIEQVILNLCLNASHAMTIMRGPGERQGGMLSVIVKRIRADQHFRKTHPQSKAEAYWVISHGDSGVGIDPEIRGKIFDPFFSTKDKESGTGLGLAMVYTIVRRHNGFIDVYSEPGVGSTFNVYLPENTESDAREDDRKETVVRGEGLILIVDDEEIIRKTAANILKECGYDVVTAENGYTGLSIFRERFKDIRAVLLDMAMPGLSGQEVYAEMRKIDRDVKVLLASGFRQDSRIEESLKMGINGYIQKPYSMIELSVMVKKIIG